MLVTSIFSFFSQCYKSYCPKRPPKSSLCGKEVREILIAQVTNQLLNSFRIIAVSYEARAFGVSRNMRGDDAKVKCPGINLVSVPQVRGKADLTK